MEQVIELFLLIIRKQYFLLLDFGHWVIRELGN